MVHYGKQLSLTLDRQEYLNSERVEAMQQALEDLDEE